LGSIVVRGREGGREGEEREKGEAISSMPIKFNFVMLPLF
jgi:hypothetical protein